MRLEVKKHKTNYEVNVFYSKRGKAVYHNIVDRDAKKIAQVLLDLVLENFPIDEAVKIYKERREKGDWLGF